MNIVLIGFSGSGKSTVGQGVAEQLGWEFVDTDVEVERVAGKPIHRIFAEDGEPSFRRLESEAVRAALQGEGRVVSVGGGAVMNPDNRRAMRDGNLVLLLEAEVDTLLERLSADTDDEPRPMLGMGVGGQRPGGNTSLADARARIEALKAAREPIYRETAHRALRTDGRSVGDVMRQVVETVKGMQDDREMSLGKSQ